MKQPMKRGTPVNMKRMSSWTSVFSGYRHTINEQRIDRWLSQFETDHKDIAARVLDCIEFVSHEQMMNAFRSILNGISSWSRDPKLREGRWRFVAFSTSAGSSGDSMLHKFRLANDLNGKQYNELFIHRSELLSEKLSSNDTVIFVDDFAGTGKQVSDYWPQTQELLPGSPRTFLVLVGASVLAIDKIRNQTDFNIISYLTLGESDNLFSSKCIHFTSDEKSAILKYCEIADRKNPKGFGECGFVIVFAHNCPNNSIPILHAHHRKWEGLFRRYD